MINLVSLLTGAIGGLIGTAVSTLFWFWQDRTARRRDWIANHLRQVYFNLVDATTYKEFEDGQSFEKKAAFAKVINEIGLFGDIATITVAEELAQKLKNSEETEEWVSYEPLLRALRDQLRDELGLTRTSKILMMHVKQIQPSEVETKPKHDEP